MIGGGSSDEDSDSHSPKHDFSTPSVIIDIEEQLDLDPSGNNQDPSGNNQDPSGNNQDPSNNARVSIG